VIERDEVEVEDAVALVEEVGDAVAPGLARAASEDDALALGGGHCEVGCE
jgi:hypothetical protein